MADAKLELASAFKDDELDDELFTIKETSEDVGILTPDEQARQDAAKRQKLDEWRSAEQNPQLGRYIDENADLDDGDVFLRDYIANMGWKMQESINNTGVGDMDSVDSDADEEFLEKADEFETKYNFRFEEAGGHAIASHSRRVEDSVRLKDSKRKKERDSRKSRKESERAEKLAELERLKNLKRQEIQSRLSEIAKATGSHVADSGADILDTEFDPETYDQEMENLLGDDYYDGEASGDDEWPDIIAEEVTNEEGQDEDVAEDEDENMWYYCDACIRPIQPGNMGYECIECEDTTICHFCKKAHVHPSSHKLAKFVVAEHEQPPSDWQTALMDIKRKRTKDIVKGKHDEMFNLEYEDLIAGEVPCRFKYAKVESDSFGLSTEAILAKPDKELNNLVSLKKLHPYRKAHAMKKVRYHDKVKRSTAEE
jgi:protein KRI1